MGARDVARAQYQGLAPQALKIRRFGAERHRFGAMPGQALGHAHQFGIRRLLEGRNLTEEWRIVDLHLMQFTQRFEFLPDGRAQRLRIHAWQGAQIELQRALTTNPVGVVAAMDAAEVQGWLRHTELRVAVLLLPLAAQCHQLADSTVHGLQGTVAQARVG
ncbi:hypothetical protein D9M73_181390 [compost metagenome]